MKKRYFIKDLEKILRVNRAAYFYWEKTGKVPKAKRTPMGNYRYWSAENIKKLKKITGGWY
ncbi:MAG: MerR family transcriptional regulator [Candidatus Omnitrophica bacterium]|nr:MerR family transcriptional regulator [Candidatus Omnitrophota bacterium]